MGLKLSCIVTHSNKQGELFCTRQGVDAVWTSNRDYRWIGGAVEAKKIADYLRKEKFSPFEIKVITIK